MTLFKVIATILLWELLKMAVIRIYNAKDNKE